MPEPLKRELTPQEVLDTGLIWMINRTLMHPNGYALAIDNTTGALTVWGNGDEPWEFCNIDEDAKLKAYRALLESVTAHG